MRFLAILGATTVAAASHAASFVLDDFSLNLAPIVRNSVGGSGAGQFIPSGTRGIILDVTAYNDPTGFSRAGSYIFGGSWSVSNDNAVTSISTAEYAFSSAKDFAGNTGLKVNFFRLDQGATLRYLIRSTAGERTGSLFVPASTVPVSASVFTNTETGIFDSSAVTYAYLTVDGPESLDFQIDSLEAVPEPATFAVLGLGAAGLLRRRRKA